MSAIKITKYDRALRQLLLAERGAKCERCGREYPEGANLSGLHTSHYFTRANWATRLDMDNVWLHCYGCHAWFEGNPHYFTQWVTEKLGTIRYEALVRRAKAVKKWKVGEKEELYQEMRDRIRELQ